MPDPLLLPAGSRLVHIGPYKTGSTALQFALHTARADLDRHGVKYAGKQSQEMAAVAWAIGRPGPHRDVARSERRWHRLVDEVQNSTRQRVMVSSELLCDAKPKAIKRIVGEFGPGVHVAVTLRPLTNILPSQWQQYVLRGLRVSYDDWLSAVLGERPRPQVTPTFWRRHRHDELVERWAAVVGHDNVSVVVLDPGDHSLLTRAFERMLGLDEGTLVTPSLRTNRSLTRAEAEVMRAFNEQFFANGGSRATHIRLMRNGAATYLRHRTPGPHEERIQTPAWALDRATAIGAEMADNLRYSGVRIIGDLALLSKPPAAKPFNPGSPTIPPEIAARLAAGLVAASRTMAERDEARSIAERAVNLLRSRELIGALRSRAKRGLARLVRKKPW